MEQAYGISPTILSSLNRMRGLDLAGASGENLLADVFSQVAGVKEEYMSANHLRISMKQLLKLACRNSRKISFVYYF